MTACRPGKTMLDHDFKWLYQLLMPASGADWQTWLQGGDLPAPTAKCPGEAGGIGLDNPDTSNCLPGSIGGGGGGLVKVKVPVRKQAAGRKKRR